MKSLMKDSLVDDNRSEFRQNLLRLLLTIEMVMIWDAIMRQLCAQKAKCCEVQKMLDYSYYITVL